MLSDFGQHFFQSIDRLRANSRDKRDDLASDLDAATTWQKEALEQVMEVMCSGTSENQNTLSKMKTSVSSGSEVITEKLEGDEKQGDPTRCSVKCGASSEEQNRVNEATKTTSGQKCKTDSTTRVRKKWTEQTDHTPSGGSSPALTLRSKRRSAIPQRGIPQSSLVLTRPKLIAVAGKSRHSTRDLDDDTERSQSRSRSANTSPREDSD